MPAPASRPDDPGSTPLSPLVAGIVVFHPDPDHLAFLARRLLAEADHLVVFLNSDVDPALREGWASNPRVTLAGSGANDGIGAGLNGIVREALRRDAGAVVLFDQDSTPPAGMPDRLRAGWRVLEAAGLTPGVVAPMLVAPSGVNSKPPRYWFRDAGAAPGTPRPVTFVPTSGSFISAAALRQVGLFRADYFIDGIDVEWCFRAAARDRGAFVMTEVRMAHSVGAGTIGSRRFGWHMPRQRPFRMYCLVRNTIYGWRLPHVPWGWKLRQALYLPVQMAAFALHHKGRGSVLRRLAAGLRDGFAGRLGPPGDTSS